MAVIATLQPLGAIICYVFVPCHILTTFMFYLRRHSFPINARYPLLTIGMMVILTPVMLYCGYSLLHPSYALPCWIIWQLLAPASSAFLPVTAIRSIILLCQLEIQADLAAAERVRSMLRDRAVNGTGMSAHDNPPFLPPTGASHNNSTISLPGMDRSALMVSTNSSGSDGSQNGNGNGNGGHGGGRIISWKPSWWTTHRKYFRGIYVRRAIIIIILVHITADLAASPLLRDSPSIGAPCTTDLQFTFRKVMILAHGVVMIPEVIIVFWVTWRLNRHRRDAFGLLTEFLWICPAVVSPVIVIILLQSVPFSLVTSSSILLLNEFWSYFLVWCMTVVRPLWLSYRHQSQLTQRSELIASVTTLWDLLLIKEGYDAFLAFTRNELMSEGVLFWKRVQEFRDASVLLVQQPPVIPSSLLTSPVAAAAATSGGGGGLVKTSSGLTNKSADLPIPVPMTRHLSLSKADAPVATATAPGHSFTVEQSQLRLLSSLVEMEKIYAHYLDIGSPNELHSLTHLRSRIRDRLDQLLVRAATSNTLTLILTTNNNGASRMQMILDDDGDTKESDSIITGAGGDIKDVVNNNNHDTNSTNTNTAATTNTNDGLTRTSLPKLFGGKPQHSMIHDLLALQAAATAPVASFPPLSPNQPNNNHPSPTVGSNTTNTNGSRGSASSSAPLPPTTTAATTITDLSASAFPYSTLSKNARDSATAAAIAKSNGGLGGIRIKKMHVRAGICVSSKLSMDDVIALEYDVRHAFDECQALVITQLEDTNGFIRFRASNDFIHLVTRMRQGQTATPPQTTNQQRRIGGGGNGVMGGGHIHLDIKSPPPPQPLKRAVGADALVNDPDEYDYNEDDSKQQREPPLPPSLPLPDKKQHNHDDTAPILSPAHTNVTLPLPPLSVAVDSTPVIPVRDMLLLDTRQDSPLSTHPSSASIITTTNTSTATAATSSPRHHRLNQHQSLRGVVAAAAAAAQQYGHRPYMLPPNHHHLAPAPHQHHYDGDMLAFGAEEPDFVTPRPAISMMGGGVQSMISPSDARALGFADGGMITGRNLSSMGGGNGSGTARGAYGSSGASSGGLATGRRYLVTPQENEHDDDDDDDDDADDGESQSAH